MRVVISAGGTGGHIYPALAIVNKIRELEPNSEFLYIGTHNRMEKEIVPKYNIPFKEIEMYGWSRKNLLKNFKTLKTLVGSYYKCKKMIKEFNPDVVIGVGGYVTAPVIYAASKLGYPTFIHEQNSLPGKTNQYLSRYASKIGVSFASSVKYFPEYKTMITGNPCSEEAILKPAMDKKELGLSKNKKLVIMVMGSLGSEKVNESLLPMMSMFNQKDYELLFVTGKKDYDSYRSKRFPSNVKVVPYVDDLVRIMKQSDLLVSRAGASTLSEIIALRIPSILIPSPYVAENHQVRNASDLVSKGAALMIEEKELKGDTLVRTIDQLLEEPERLESMKEALKGLGVEGSATMIYKTLEEMIQSNK